MKIINMLVLRELRGNRKRSIGIVVGITLSVALICAVAGMFFCLRETFIEVERRDGNYHFEYLNVDAETLDSIKLNRSVAAVSTMGILGDYLSDDEMLFRVYSVYEDYIFPIDKSIVKGRFPENEHEIALGKDYMRALGCSLGDTISLSLGKYSYDLADKKWMPCGEITSHEFTVVGQLGSHPYGYDAFTKGAVAESFDAYIRLKEPKKYRKIIEDIAGADNENVEINYGLLHWEIMEFSDSDTKAFYSIMGVVIFVILLTSVFCIRNSFDISIMEKKKTYGMLASIGATKKQIKKNVLFQGMYLAGIGIPLGIICGELAVYILCKVVTAILQNLKTTDGEAFEFIFCISPVSIFIAVIVGALTVYLSTIISAVVASRTSPIANIRSNSDINIKGKKLKSPKIVNKLFGIGGIIAYKNLKRSKRKYKTTVISISVSVFVFIAMNSFLLEMKRQTVAIFKEYDYNIVINVHGKTNKEFEALIDNVEDDSNVLYEAWDVYDYLISDLDKVILFDDEESSYEDSFGYNIYLLNDETFRAYAKKCKVSVADGECILNDYFIHANKATSGLKKERRTKFSDGDTIKGVFKNINDDGREVSADFKIGAVTDTRPYGYENIENDVPLIIVNEKHFSFLKEKARRLIYADAINPDEVEDYVLDYIGSCDEDYIGVQNYDYIARSSHYTILLISIFMYGFITVISLIGVTNIFNTITSNMELRQKEFAMLKSIGMTKKEFRKMVNLETVFYSFKALIIGIVSGLIASYFLHSSMNERLEEAYILPLNAIIISIVFVFVLVYIIMRYSIKRINRQNTIETIRRDVV